MLEGSELAACFTEPALLDKALRGAQDNDFAALRFEASLHRVGGDALPVHVTVSLAERPGHVDRKSTRLNSSHSQISYAVFCLKKKNQTASRGRRGGDLR